MKFWPIVAALAAAAGLGVPVGVRATHTERATTHTTPTTDGAAPLTGAAAWPTASATAAGPRRAGGAAAAPPAAQPAVAGAQTKAGPTYVGRSRILFNRTVDTPDGRRTDIYTVRPDGRSEQRLTDGTGERFAGGYSPHGSHIAYVVGGTAGELWTMRGDGTRPQRLGDLTGSCPRYSPDGTRIAYRTGEFGEIWVAAADGSDAHRVSGSVADYDQCPSWSPDGRRLSFVRFTGMAISDVWVSDADGANATRLTTDGAVKTSAAWSPDGLMIAYDRGGDIWLMAADGSEQRPLTTDPAAESDPVWNTHSTKIAYARATDSGYELWVVELGGRAHAVGVDGAPAAWRGH